MGYKCHCMAAIIGLSLRYRMATFVNSLSGVKIVVPVNEVMLVKAHQLRIILAIGLASAEPLALGRVPEILLCKAVGVDRGPPWKGSPGDRSCGFYP